MLANKSIVELRGIAQALSVPDVFQKDKPQLLQAIELKQQKYTVTPKIEIPKPQYDARLMTKPPSKRALPQDVTELLAPYIARGLQFTIDENAERWQMSFGKKTDEGTMRMPLRIVLRCAQKIME